MQHPAELSPLGKTSAYVDQYSPALLFPIPRAAKWAELGLQAGRLPYHGVDIWNCYELSWLLPSGKPVVALAEFRIPADSPHIIESKSFKLYLNSLNQSVFADAQTLQQIIAADLSGVAGAPVTVRLSSVREAGPHVLGEVPGLCIDDLDIQVQGYDQPRPELLRCTPEAGAATLHSHLLKSNCPVTHQPDWGTLVVSYRAERSLDAASLLAYLVSFRQHADFHEQCVERVYLDLLRLLAPQELVVYARYVRRGGLDINPWRSLLPGEPENLRLVRQ